MYEAGGGGQLPPPLNSGKNVGIFGQIGQSLGNIQVKYHITVSFRQIIVYVDVYLRKQLFCFGMPILYTFIIVWTILA